jgi:hypothetical protein
VGKRRQSKGPEPDRLKIEGDFADAVRKALAKKKPATGWPKAERYAPRKKRGAKKPK